MAFQTLINGVTQTSWPVADRGLAYGDGVFETFRVIEGRVGLFNRHWQRLKYSLQRLDIPVPLSEEQLIRAIADVVDGGDGVAKLMVTRGSGGRGYRCPDNPDSQWSLQGFPLPEIESEHYASGVSVRSCRLQLAEQPALAGMKHLNRLEQVMARQEWQNEYFEGLMFSRSGYLVEATMANIFLVHKDRLLTPRLNLCGVKGVMRDAILEQGPAISGALAMPCETPVLSASDLLQADSAFICNSVRGIIPLSHWYDEQGGLIQSWDSAEHSVVKALIGAFHPAMKLPIV
ncbi:aminodeoxychorismate lyase [Oceanospirillum linum]|uniref:Aminodeoxychorismate lyase n=1 Tax=Oceanospirillum linum TaxID=966 RepID=A0A1T1HEL8_OCELI|nr:aminodeoxychorismate lyase [Oceanospirillum linum]OOV88252.1 aminodeoxychorismate lyase [Oceanospirillum linum]SEF49855.1 aminodeoxychorismate lyase apoprotein [Oleiphilus messinensis]SMP03686.1 aminodeoxychorismate lyase apoprotein [Oceanospirillum linum]